VTIKDVLELVLYRGLPMIFVYWVLSRPVVDTLLMKTQTFFNEKIGVSMAMVKRGVAIVLSVGISLLAFSLYATLGYATLPVDLEGWLNLLVGFTALTFSGSQVIHGVRDL